MQFVAMRNDHDMRVFQLAELLQALQMVADIAQSLCHIFRLFVIELVNDILTAQRRPIKLGGVIGAGKSQIGDQNKGK